MQQGELEIETKDHKEDADSEAMENHPLNDDHFNKPRRGSRKKRMVDYYDGPDRDVKKHKESGKTSKASKVKGIIESEHNTPPKNKGAHEGDGMQPGTSNQARILVSENNNGNIDCKESASDFPKKARLEKRNVRKGKTLKKAENKNQRSVDDCNDAKSVSNETTSKKVTKSSEVKLKVVRMSEPLEEKLGPTAHSEKIYSEHSMPMIENDPPAENYVNSPDNKIQSPHTEKGPADEAQRDLPTCQQQISPKTCFPEQSQSLKDDGPIPKAYSRDKSSADTIKSVVEKDNTREDDLPVFAANMASSVKTFLPPNPVEFLSNKASESKGIEEKNFVEENRVTQEQHEVERIEAERLEEEAMEAKKRDEIRRQEEESIARRKAKEEEEKRKREEKAKRLEEHKKRRKLEAEAAAQVGSAMTGLVGPSSGSGGSLAAAKERLAKIQQQAAMLKGQKSNNEKASLSGKVISGTPKISTLNITGNMVTPQSLMTISSPDGKGGNFTESKSHQKSYEISPYKSDHDSDDDVPRKPVPDWARGKALMAQLFAQMYVDPDEVFQQHAKTCSLDQVFGSCRKPGKQNFDRRSSSGNWIEDRVTWKEEVGYKKAMGYI